MKKTIMVFVLLLMGFLFVGCNSDEQLTGITNDLNDLQQSIYALETALSDLEATNVSLNASISALEQANTLLTQELETVITNASLETTRINAEFIALQYETQVLTNDVGRVDQEINELNAVINQPINSKLAKEYSLVVGDTFQLFYRSVVQAVDPYNYYIKLTSTKGYAYPRYYEWRP
jgi:prefoldin subunit 5